MIFGGQTVTFVVVSEDEDNRDRYNSPTKVRTEVAVPGCRFRPMSTTEARWSEEIDTGDRAYEAWKCTAPPVSAVLDATAIDEVKVDGITYQLLGSVRPFTDMEGSLYKVTLLCTRTIA